MTRLSNFEKYKIDHAVQQQFSHSFRDQNLLDGSFQGPEDFRSDQDQRNSNIPGGT